MRTAPVKDLRTKFPTIEGWVRAGETVVITKNGRPVATLSGPPQADRPNMAKRFGGPVKQPHVLPTGQGAVDLLLEDRGS